MDPLVDPDSALGAALRGVVEEIAAELSRTEGTDPTLAGGWTGMALFQAYRYRELAAADGAEWAERWMSQAVERLADTPLPPSLQGGYVGIAWAVEHLREELGIPEDEDPGADIDDALRTLLDAGPWRGHLELIGGLVGLGVHAFERLERGRGGGLLERIVARLEEQAHPTPQGVTWHTPASLLPDWQRALYPSGYFNLGLAHGVPGLLLFLARAQAHGVAPHRTRPLLEGGLRWLEAQKREEDGGPMFAPLVTGDGAPRASQPPRVAWCYGDLGLSGALLQTARSVGDAAWEARALEAARRAALRPFEHSGVVDAGLCHGAAGNAHLFHRLYRSTGEAVFREAAHAWLARVLQLRRPGEGVGGFPAWVDDGRRRGWVADPGLLTGAAGVGLALLAATGRGEPAWDRVLLASAR